MPVLFYTLFDDFHYDLFDQFLPELFIVFGFWGGFTLVMSC